MKWITCLFWSVLAMSCLTFSQERPITFTSNTQLVLIPVIVTENKNPAIGLTKEDFVLLHDGSPESLAVFEEVDAVPARMKRVDLPARTVQNYAEASAHQDVLILVLDFLSGSWSTAARMRSYVSQITNQLNETHTPVTLLLLTSKGLVQVHSFSSDPQNLTKAVEQWTSKTSTRNREISSVLPSWASPLGATQESQSLTAMNFAVIEEFNKQGALEMAKITEDAAEHVAHAFRGVSGRKKLIWMSTGFVAPVSSASAIQKSAAGSMDTVFKIAEMRARAWKTLSDANIAVYTLDSNGSANPTWEEHFSASHAGDRLNQLAPPVSIEVSSDTGSLMEVAQKTGGLSCVDLPPSCVKRVQADGNHYYLLGFYLRGEKRLGWHQLKVESKRPNLTIRTREGFIVGNTSSVSLTKEQEPKKHSTKDQKKQGSEQSDKANLDKEIVIAALSSPLDYTSVPLRLHWSKLPESGKGNQIELVLNSPPGGVSVGTESMELNVDYLAFIRPIGKTEGQTFPDTLALKLSPAQQNDLSINGFRYRKQVSLAPGRYEVRVLLRDNLSQRIGTVSTVIDLSSASASVQ